MLGSTALAEFYFDILVHIIEKKILLLSLETVFFVLLLIFNVLAVLKAIDFVLLSLNVE